MDSFEQIKQLIKNDIDDAHIEITDLTGTNDHIGLLVVSDLFQGKMLLEQHQMVMDILKEKLKAELHAVQVKTMTHEKYKKLNA